MHHPTEGSRGLASKEAKENQPENQEFYQPYTLGNEVQIAVREEKTKFIKETPNDQVNIRPLLHQIYGVTNSNS